MAHILFSSVFPFGPLVIEFLIFHSVKDGNILISIAMYVLAVSIVSRNALFFVFGIGAMACLLVIYGLFLAQSNLVTPDRTIPVAMGIAAIMTFSNVFNGYQDYIMRGKAFLEI